MSIIKPIFVLLLFVFTQSLCYGQKDSLTWERIDYSEDMDIFYRKFDDTNIKELKIIFESPALAKDWILAIRNIETMPSWSVTCRSTSLVKQDADNTLYFYFIVDIPWPIRGRDVVLQMHSFIDSITGNSIITSNNFDGLVAEKEDYKRVDYMKARWEFVQLSNGITVIEYFISTEISNSFPDWLVQKAITYSPVKSIAALREIVEK